MRWCAASRMPSASRQRCKTTSRSYVTRQRRANDVEQNRSTVSRDAFARRIRATPSLGGVMTDRLPPGQVLTTKWPVLHYGNVPKVDTATWTFDVTGLVERPLAVTCQELLALPRDAVVGGMDCVAREGRLDHGFRGG